MEKMEKSTNIVAKFGGTSMCDAEAFRISKEIVLGNPLIKVVVVSAPGKRSFDDDKMTDLLRKICTLRSQSENFWDIWKIIADRFLEIAEELRLNKIILRQKLDSLYYKRIMEGCSEAEVLSIGENITAGLFAGYLNCEFTDAYSVVFIGKDKNPSFTKKLTLEKRTVIPGFYGRGVSGEITTFTRGGSDVTAAYLAAQLGFDLERWSDSAVCVTNPKMVPHALVVKEMSHAEMDNISSIVPNVLHPAATEICMKYNVTVRVKNVQDPQGSFTTVIPKRDATTFPIAGINIQENYVNFSISQPGMGSSIGVASVITGIFADMGITIRTIGGGANSISLLMHEKNLNGKNANDVMAAIKSHYRLSSHKVTTQDQMSVISVVGDGMINAKNYLGRVTSVIGDADISIFAIESPPGEGVIEIFIDQRDGKRAVEALYNEFFPNE